MGENRVKVENILAKNISSVGDKASYDAACKRLLANRAVLAFKMEYMKFNGNFTTL